jgi:hypothetical protein
LTDVFLDRINAAPIEADNFSFDFISWISTFVDTMNSILDDIQISLNSNDDGIIVPQFTTAEIITLSATADDGTLWYCTDSSPPNFVGKINGALRQFTTSAFP